MSLTTAQLKFRRGVRALAKDADLTATKGVDFAITHETTPSTITIWNVAKLGVEPTAEQIDARAETRRAARLANLLRIHAEKRIEEVHGSGIRLAADALRLAYLSSQRQDRTLTGAEDTQLTNLTAKAEAVQTMNRAITTIRNTIVYGDDPEDVYARYDAEIA